MALCKCKIIWNQSHRVQIKADLKYERAIKQKKYGQLNTSNGSSWKDNLSSKIFAYFKTLLGAFSSSETFSKYIKESCRYMLHNSVFSLTSCLTAKQFKSHGSKKSAIK